MKPPSPIRLLLVDDHFFVRQGLAYSLNEETDCEVVAEARNADEALQLYRSHRPDVTLMDLMLEGSDGISATTRIRSEFPEARILVFSVNEGEEDVYRALEAGAAGYLPKSVERAELLDAIRTVHRGGQYVPPELSARLATRRARPNLSPREHAVLERIVAGRSNKEIASDLGISELTVRQYVSNLLEKLDVMDRTQAVTAAVQRGIVRLT